MVQMTATYVDFGFSTDPEELDYVTSFQAERRSITQVESRAFSTNVEVGMFLTELLIIVTAISGLIATALVCHFKMEHRKRSKYVLGFRVSEVAGLSQPGICQLQGESLFLTVHPDFPQLTVSRTPANCSQWTLDKVLRTIC